MTNLVILVGLQTTNVRFIDHFKMAGFLNVLFVLAVTIYTAAIFNSESCKADERFPDEKDVEPAAAYLLCAGGTLMAFIFDPLTLIGCSILDKQNEKDAHKLRGTFDSFDADKSRTLDQAEAKEFLGTLGHDVAAFADDWALMNRSGGDTVDFAEFEAYHIEHASKSPSTLTVTGVNYAVIMDTLKKILVGYRTSPRPRSNNKRSRQPWSTILSQAGPHEGGQADAGVHVHCHLRPRAVRAAVRRRH